MASQSFEPDADFDKFDYTGPSILTPNACQKACLFRADDRRWGRPSAGRPTLVYVANGGFRFTNLVRSIGPKELYENVTTPDSSATYLEHRFLRMWLMNGGNVVTAAATPSFGAGVGNKTTGGQVVGVANAEYPGGVPVADIDFDAAYIETDYDYGTAPDGNGICMPWHNGVYPTGYRDSAGKTQAQGAIHPFQDPARHNAFMDMEMLSQFIHANHVAMGIDIDRVYGMGGSGSADINAWCALHTDRAPQRWLNPSGQELLSTDIFKGGFYWSWQPYINMLKNAYLDPRGMCRCPQPTSHILANHYDVCGTTILNISRNDLKQGDLMHYATAAGIAGKLLVTHFTDNDTYDATPGGTATDTEGDGPWDTPVEAGLSADGVAPALVLTGTDPHDGYGLGLVKTLMGAGCVGYKLNGMNCNASGLLTFDTDADGYEALHVRALNFLWAHTSAVRSWAFRPRGM
jgi:hypothetical protein